MFFPWHRVFIRILEQDIQSIMGNTAFGLPYFSWGTNANNWNLPSSGILTSTLFGTSGISNPNFCVKNGVASSWIATDGSCLRRLFDGNSISATNVNLYTESWLLSTLSADPSTGRAYTSFNAFSQQIDYYPHGSFHVAIGYYDSSNTYYGHMTDATVSPNDPVFYLHHGNMDRYYKYWQKLNPSLASAYDGTQPFPPYGSNYVNVKKTDILPGFNVPVSVGLQYETASACYKYVAYSGSIASIKSNPKLARRQFNKQPKSFPEALGKWNTSAIALRVKAKVSDLDSIINEPLSMSSISVFDDGSLALPDGRKYGVPERVMMSPLPEKFILMRKMDVAKTRAWEEKARGLMNRINDRVDKVLERVFSTNFTRTNFVQHAIAVKIAIAELSS